MDITEKQYHKSLEKWKEFIKITDDKITNKQIQEQQKCWDIKKRYEKQLSDTADRLKANEKQQEVDWEELRRLKKERKLDPYWYDSYKYFVHLKAGVINMSRIADSLKNPTTLLFYLLQWRTWKDESGKIKDALGKKWYDAGYIITHRAQEVMALDLGVSERTINRWIKQLVRDRLIVVEKVGLQNIYVVGLINDDGLESYFYCGDCPVYRGQD